MRVGALLKGGRTHIISLDELDEMTDSKIMSRKPFIASITDLVADVGRARNASYLFDQLSNLSDSELSRRGIKRADIARISYRAAFPG